jgi:hypothetical protein
MARTSFTKIVGTVVFLLLILYITLCLTGVIAKDNRLTTTEIVLIAVALVFSSGLAERLGDITVGKEGVKARFEKIEERQDLQENHVRALRFVLKHALSKFEVDKLRGLAGSTSFMVRSHPELHQELKRLDAGALLRPLLPGGLEEIKTRYGDEKELFDLKTCVAITEDGKDYLKLYDEL